MQGVRPAQMVMGNTQGLERARHKEKEEQHLRFKVTDTCFELCVSNFHTREIDHVRLLLSLSCPCPEPWPGDFDPPDKIQATYNLHCLVIRVCFASCLLPIPNTLALLFSRASCDDLPFTHYPL